MNNPKLTPFLREKIEMLLQANCEMRAELRNEASTASAEASVMQFDFAVDDVIAAARAAGFVPKKVEAA
jgi:hypothetical protein